jgi:hypothetical protein
MSSISADGEQESGMLLWLQSYASASDGGLGDLTGLAMLHPPLLQVSFHRYGDYFPGTGAVEDVGHGKGRGYCVNVPLKDGMDDESYRYVYEPIMTKVSGPAVAAACWVGGTDQLPEVCGAVHGAYDAAMLFVEGCRSVLGLLMLC